MIRKKLQKTIKRLSVLSACTLILCCTLSCGGTNDTPQADTLSEPEGASINEWTIPETTTVNTEAETDTTSPAETSDTKTADTETSENPDVSSTEPVPVDIPDVEAWQRAYIDYINALESKDACTYSLIYVDEDDIPELVINTGYEAGGCMLLTWHTNRLDVLQTSRLYFNYIEKGSLLCNQEGNMGYYYDDVYTIKDGKWNYLCGGTYQDSKDGAALDEEGNFIYVYAWNGETVNEAEYKEKLNAAYPLIRL